MGRMRWWWGVGRCDLVAGLGGGTGYRNRPASAIGEFLAGDRFAAVAVSERCVVSFPSPRHCRHPFHAPTDGISDRSEMDYAYRRMLNAILPNRLQSAAFQDVNTWRGFTIADVNPRTNVELAQELSPTVQWTTFWSRATRRPSRGLAGSPTHRPSVPQRLLVR